MLFSKDCKILETYSSLRFTIIKNMLLENNIHYKECTSNHCYQLFVSKRNHEKAELLVQQYATC